MADWTFVFHTGVLVYPFREQNKRYFDRRSQAIKLMRRMRKNKLLNYFRYDDYLIEQAKANFSS
jgi:hypothetical protein